MTLREKVLVALVGGDPAYEHNRVSAIDDLDAIATILEDTGSTAHMRVASELRGE